MEQNRNRSLSASALSTRMESASGDVPPSISAAGAWPRWGSAALRVPSMPGGLPPLPTFKALPQWDCRNVFSPPRSDTYTSMPPQRAKESLSSLMGQAAGGQPQLPFQRGFPTPMGWGCRMSAQAFHVCRGRGPSTTRLQVGESHTSVASEDGRAAMQTSNMEVGLCGQAETQRGAFGGTGGGVHTGVAGEDGRAAMQTSNMEVGLRGQAETQRGAFGGGGPPPICPIARSNGFHTAGNGRWGELATLPQRKGAGRMQWSCGGHCQDAGSAGDGDCRCGGDRRRQRAESDMSEGSKYQCTGGGGRRGRSDSPAAGGRDETMSDITTTLADSNKQNAEMLVGTFVTALEGLNKTMADGNTALLQCFVVLTRPLAGCFARDSNGHGDRDGEGRPHEQ
ncbi:hypothetical protein CBR_g846 [Chara braunii]|uniref:Uncharacterized protein n=1 Tax=Chara braunii TaxID=69332 RepID=A0A388KCD4_CHABU|nr:hypothetical protein CBR_g846 [Chara braunii]|eukprot:GBG67718.1 hypothetical protein CBR_g846 [Chara braunii]